ncbi:MAG: hypothetical protein AB8F74_10135 [Saprospiraceae bacterium]
MKKIFLFIFLLITTLIIANNFPEHYFKAKLECVSNSDNDLQPAVQQQLITQLKSKQPSDFRYFFKTFDEEGEQTFMITSFRNEATCFNVKVLVEQWNKLGGMRRTNGKAYPKELYDLKWEVKEIDGKEVVYYLDMHRIID